MVVFNKRENSNIYKVQFSGKLNKAYQNLPKNLCMNIYSNSSTQNLYLLKNLHMNMYSSS